MLWYEFFQNPCSPAHCPRILARAHPSLPAAHWIQSLPHTLQWPAVMAQILARSSVCKASLGYREKDSEQSGSLEHQPCTHLVPFLLGTENGRRKSSLFLLMTHRSMLLPDPKSLKMPAAMASLTSFLASSSWEKDRQLLHRVPAVSCRPAEKPQGVLTLNARDLKAPKCLAYSCSTAGQGTGPFKP